jgi:hypothetical protein
MLVLQPAVLDGWGSSVFYTATAPKIQHILILMFNAFITISVVLLVVFRKPL